MRTKHIWTIAAAAAFIALSCAAWVLSPSGVFGRSVPPSSIQPQFRWVIKVNNEPVDVAGRQMINVVKGDVVQAWVDVDWNGHGPGIIELSTDTRTFKPGEKLTADRLGAFGIEYSSIGPSWMAHKSIVFKVNDYPRFNVDARVIDLAVRNGEPLDISAVTVQVWSDELDMESIRLNHVTLWLQDAKHRALCDGIALAGQAAGGQETGHLTSVEDAQSDDDIEFANGAWILRFDRPAAALPLQQWPTEIMVFGTGSREGETIEFVARSSFLARPRDS